MKNKLVKFNYTKDTGDESFRKAIVMAVPRQHHLMLDVTDEEPEVVSEILELLHRQEQEWDQMADAVQPLKWRTFKASGIDWIQK